jgi:hypothetical protein
VNEPRDLIEARRRLARAEGELQTDEGLLELQEGLGLLEYVATNPAAGTHRQVAYNLGKTYAIKIQERVARELQSGRNLPEPALRHAFEVLRSFDHTCFDVPPARALKIELVRRIIDILYEGYSPDEKQRAYEELTKIAGAASDD